MVADFQLQIDCVIFSAGIQRQIDFTKPDAIDLDRKPSAHSPLTSHMS